MMPLGFARVGETGTVLTVQGNSEMKKRLEDLGFTRGAKVRVVASLHGNLIVNIRDSRIGIDGDMARRVMVDALEKGDTDENIEGNGHRGNCARGTCARRRCR
ncbi:MAG: ferrous iron transport protein A [Tissierellia bacterium]|nr:FeoA family protein [Bacillota bacterium]NLK58508.1 ferrous iron transport protein A [Tissierellia bacterium]